MAENDAQVAGQRRKRKRRLGHPDRKLPGKIATSRFGSILFGLMVIVLLGYCSLIFLQVRNATQVFGPYALGMSQADVRYRFGQPMGTGLGSGVWSYVNAGSKISLRFGSDGQLVNLTCFQERVYEGPCPNELGVGIGTTESELIRLLGPADTVRYDREDKIVRYHGLGLMLRMRKLRVVEVGRSPATSTPGMLKVALWRMLP